MLRRLLAFMLAPLERWVLSKIRSEHEIRGFRVVLDNSRPDIASEAVLRRFTDALDLIAEVQPWRYAHLQRDVRLFWIVRQPVRGSYHHGCRRITTELTFLARTDIGPATVAASIVYQTILARLAHLPLRTESYDQQRARRICYRAVLAFGRALPLDEGAPVVAYAESALARTDEELSFEIDWNEARRRQRAVDREAFRSWRRGTA
jgi:hypothetical protein